VPECLLLLHALGMVRCSVAFERDPTLFGETDT